MGRWLSGRGLLLDDAEFSCERLLAMAEDRWQLRVRDRVTAEGGSRGNGRGRWGLLAVAEEAVEGFGVVGHYEIAEEGGEGQKG